MEDWLAEKRAEAAQKGTPRRPAATTPGTDANAIRLREIELENERLKEDLRRSDQMRERDRFKEVFGSEAKAAGCSDPGYAQWFILDRAERVEEQDPAQWEFIQSEPTEIAKFRADALAELKQSMPALFKAVVDAPASTTPAGTRPAAAGAPAADPNQPKHIDDMTPAEKKARLARFGLEPNGPG